MSDEEQVGSPEEQVRELFDQLQSQGERTKKAALRKESPSVVLAMQAMKVEGDAREELREVVFSEEVSNEDWAAWALSHLSAYSEAITLAEANLTVTRHNIKTLFRMEGF
ncbi:hypothetical protein OV320_7875 [Actinobacteria bacterium OV320]|nr:hypothetical protein OV320_7875 [Actinobacteria bacterium OV320]